MTSIHFLIFTHAGLARFGNDAYAEALIALSSNTPP